jgi:hypothetical protein
MSARLEKGLLEEACPISELRVMGVFRLRVFGITIWSSL